MNKFLVYFLVATCGLLNAQNKWRDGYYITNAGVNVKGFIFDKQWKANPSEFLFRPTQNSTDIVVPMNEALEFSIPGAYKFVRETVEMERSSSEAHLLQRFKNPIFQQETHYLRVLVEGKNSLYLYNGQGIRKYFYKADNGLITQLINISYLDGPHSIDILVNAQFRNQLWNAVKCDETKLKDVENLLYETSSLTRYFHNVNSCGTEASVTFEEKVRKGKFNLKIQAGISPAKMHVEGPTSVAFDASAAMPVFGAELEYVLPTTNSKWSLFVEGNYNIFTAEADTPNQHHVKVNYNFIQFPLGIRHYFFLNSQSRIFVSGAAAANLLVRSDFDYSVGRDYEGQTDAVNFGVGAGFEFNRISAEVRYYNKVSPLARIENHFSRFSAVLKFRVL